MNKSFNDHKYQIFLDRKLYLAAIQLQAERGLGKSYSVLLPCVEGLHLMGYLNDADYEVYKAKYSIGLEEAANIPTASQIKAEEKQHNKNRQLNRHFGEVLAQWSQLKESAKEYHLKEAKKHCTLKNAQLLLDLAKPSSLEVS